MICSYCGQMLPDGNKFCKYCGKPTAAFGGGQAPVTNEPVADDIPVCEVCGNPGTPGKKFCRLCGGRLVIKPVVTDETKADETPFFDGGTQEPVIDTPVENPGEDVPVFTFNPPEEVPDEDIPAQNEPEIPVLSPTDVVMSVDMGMSTSDVIATNSEDKFVPAEISPKKLVEELDMGIDAADTNADEIAPVQPEISEVACPGCGRYNAPTSKFCFACGTRIILPEPVVAPEEKPAQDVLSFDETPGDGVISVKISEPEIPAGEPAPVCPVCGRIGTPGKKFCAHCGSALTAPAPIEQEPAPETIEEPAVETPVDDVPVFEPPVFEMPVFEVPAEETPVFEMPAEETPVFEMPAEQTPVEEAPEVEETPVEPEVEPLPVCTVCGREGIIGKSFCMYCGGRTAIPEPAIEDPATDVIEITQPEEEVPAAEEIPEIEVAPEIEEVPAVEEIPEVEDVPEIENIPEIEVIPEAEVVPENEDLPEVEVIPEPEEPVEEPVEEAPEVAETPVEPEEAAPDADIPVIGSQTVEPEVISAPVGEAADIEPDFSGYVFCPKCGTKRFPGFNFCGICGFAFVRK